jgi:hypothetical protein
VPSHSQRSETFAKLTQETRKKSRKVFAFLHQVMRCNRTVSGSILIRDFLLERECCFFVPVSTVRMLGCDVLPDGVGMKLQDRPDYLVSSLRTTNPMLFHADTCIDHQLPIDFHGHPFRHSVAVEMKKLAKERGYKSLYWLPDTVVPDFFDVAIKQDAPRIAVSDERLMEYFVNADETTDPYAFNRVSCFDYPAAFFPNKPATKASFLCRKAAIEALAEDFTRDGQHWISSEIGRGGGGRPPDGNAACTGADESRQQHCQIGVRSSTFPRGITSTWLDTSVLGPEKSCELVLHPNAFIAPGGFVNSADVDLPTNVLHDILQYAPLEAKSLAPFTGQQRVQMAVSAVLNSSSSSNKWATMDVVRELQLSADRRVPPVLVPGMGLVHCVESATERRKRKIIL